MNRYHCRIMYYLERGVLSYGIKYAVIKADTAVDACLIASLSVKNFKKCEVINITDADPFDTRGIIWE